MSKSRGKLWRSPSTLRIRLSRHLAIQYLIHAAIYMVLVIVWLYWYMNNLWDRIGPYSGGRIELPRIALFLIGFGLPVAHQQFFHVPTVVLHRGDGANLFFAEWLLIV